MLRDQGLVAFSVLFGTMIIRLDLGYGRGRGSFRAKRGVQLGIGFGNRGLRFFQPAQNCRRGHWNIQFRRLQVGLLTSYLSCQTLDDGAVVVRIQPCQFGSRRNNASVVYGRIDPNDGTANARINGMNVSINLCIVGTLALRCVNPITEGSRQHEHGGRNDNCHVESRCFRDVCFLCRYIHGRICLSEIFWVLTYSVRLGSAIPKARINSSLARLCALMLAIRFSSEAATAS